MSIRNGITLRQLKLGSLAVSGLALVLLWFFERTKHVPALAAVNPFAEDPFDGIGSFGIQLSMFAALLSLVRAFRPYPNAVVTSVQLVPTLRAWTVSVMAVAVTLAGDVMALIRYPFAWATTKAGKVLALLVGGMSVLAAMKEPECSSDTRYLSDSWGFSGTSTERSD